MMTIPPAPPVGALTAALDGFVTLARLMSPSEWVVLAAALALFVAACVVATSGPRHPVPAGQRQEQEARR